MKSTTLYNYGDHLLFVVNHRFNDGIVRMTSEIEIFDVTDCQDTLTRKLKTCFEKFDVGSEYKIEMNKAFQSRISEAVGVKKYNDFIKGSNMIKLVDVGDEIKLQPLKSADKFRGYDSYQGIIESFSKEELESNQVVQAILRLFDQMKSQIDDPA